MTLVSVCIEVSIINTTALGNVFDVVTKSQNINDFDLEYKVSKI